MDANYFNVLIATDTEANAIALAQAIVDQRLAACVQITPTRSVFRWRGAVKMVSEWRLDCKTSAARLADLLAIARDLHPYELPEIIALPIVDGLPGYLRWIDEETAL